QFILSASNDAHYSPSMPFQHHALDIMRAIETDRWSVRATNTGYSAFVDPHGHTLWISGYNTYATHAETIYKRETRTLYVRWGDWLTVVLLGLAGFFYQVIRLT
ncbi:apolipoprotein N-acyltransferase, partial [Anabaena sp. CS-542/02]|nr:apolipoprotein N-acyltransferase [Anabaena sp. CS-542/02]